MELVLYGAGKIGKKAYELIKQYYSNTCKVDCFLDSVKTGKFCDVEINSIDTVKKDAIIIITIGDMCKVIDVYTILKKKGFQKIYWFIDFVHDTTKDLDFLAQECWKIENLGDCILPHLELHISDKCNLNCKGCAHFSPLFDEIDLGFDNIMDDLIKLSKIFSNVARLDILGGEPLLNKDLSKYIIEIRKLFPNTFIDIFTNGLLIPTLSEETLECIRNNHVFISITEYKPTHLMIEKIRLYLKKANIKYILVPYDIRQKFNKPISISKNSKYDNLCISNGCVTVAYGKIARCPTLMYINKFNEFFNTQLPNDGIVKLDEVTSGYDLLEKLKEEVPLCKHCIKCDMEWEVCGKNIKFEDFAVED